MEPMNLGSPLSSPTSPNSYSSFYHTQPSGMGNPAPGPVPHTHTGFLPGYLMGDYTQQVSPINSVV